MRINTNVSAINTWRSMYQNDNKLSKSMEKLSSGLRINRASDDAGGLGLSETLRSQIRGTAQAEKNAQDAIGLLNIADSTLDNVHGMLQRMRELAVQAANGTLTLTDRTNLSTEMAQLATTGTGEIDREIAAGQFNGTPIFSGAPITFQVGPNNSANDQLSITVATNNAATLLVDVPGNVDITTQAGAQAAITAITTAIDTISTQRADIGAMTNRVEYTISNLQTTRENLSAAESRIRDTDMASEMTNMTKLQIMTQAATAMLAQANAKPQSVLQLLQG